MKAEAISKIRHVFHKDDQKKSFSPVLFIGIVLISIMVALLTMFFYRSLEREIYVERAAYLKEISEQIVSTTDTISSAQWDMASIFSKHIHYINSFDSEGLPAFIEKEEEAFNQQGLSLLVFDERGNYYDSEGNQARWTGHQTYVQEDAPVRQVEITTLPTTTGTNDEMIFILQMEMPILLDAENTYLTHVAVVRNMSVFNETFQIPSFEGRGENYIISNVGTRIYRGQAASSVVGDVYNVIKPLEGMTFHYGSSYEMLKQAVADGESTSLEFSGEDGNEYYVTCAPMKTNNWLLLSIISSDVVSRQMQQFMNKTLLGIGAIALIIVAAISAAIILVVRYRGDRQRMQEQALTNAALQDAARAAEEASRAKTVFLSHMSHDIRTPINGIMGMTDIAFRNMGDSDRVADCLTKIVSASRHLLSLINDVLDMSRIESGKVHLESKPFYVNTLLDGCSSVILGQVQERQLRLQTDFAGITIQQLRGDELHLRQILINILGNAVKFTPKGGEISFTAWDEPMGEDEVCLTVVISDNGIGMSEEFQQRIFEPFAQAENGSRSSYQGTGLGMSIVRQLLDLMGGTIELESIQGKGSTFTVRVCLPVEMSKEQEQTSMKGDIDLNGMQVLLVEDNALNMEIAQYILEDCGAVVTQAENGRQALDIFSRKPYKNFDVILMDVMMPVMDGLEAAQAIRACSRDDAAAVPIIAMTANAYEEDKKAVIKAGMDRHLAKPIERPELIRVLSEYYRK